MSDRIRSVISFAGIILLVGAMAFILVRLGEPQSVWLWCDMLHLCEG